MRIRNTVQSWLRRHRPLFVRLQGRWNGMRIEIGCGFAFWASLIFVVVQSGNG
jgi:hypothetical protein